VDVRKQGTQTRSQGGFFLWRSEMNFSNAATLTGGLPLPSRENMAADFRKSTLFLKNFQRFGLSKTC